jgi:hypothetical protein
MVEALASRVAFELEVEVGVVFVYRTFIVSGRVFVSAFVAGQRRFVSFVG